MGFKLYKFQEAALDWIMSKYVDCYTQGWYIVRSPTATGKTFIGLMALFRIYKRTNIANNLYFLTYTRIAESQTKDKLYQLLESGLIDQIFYRSMQGQIQTIQSYKSNSKNIVVVDEAHHLTPKSKYASFLKDLETNFLIGLTGTPKVDYKETGFHHEIFCIKREDTGIEFPSIEKIDVELSSKDVSTIRIKTDYHKNDGNLDLLLSYMGNFENKDEKYDSKIRMIAQIVYSKKNEFKKCIVFYRFDNGRASGLVEKLTSLFGKNSVLPLYGEEFRNMNELKRSLKFFQSDPSQRIIIGEDMLTEALDIPSIDALFMTGQTKSDLKYSQMIGRGIRRNKNKSTLKIFDLRKNFEIYHSAISQPDHFYKGSQTYLYDNVENWNKSGNITFYRPHLDHHNINRRLIEQLDYFGIILGSKNRIPSGKYLTKEEISDFLLLLCFEFEANSHRLDEYYWSHQKEIYEYINHRENKNFRLGLVSTISSKPLEVRLVKYLIKPLMELKYSNSIHFETELKVDFEESFGRIDIMALGDSQTIFEFAIDDAKEKHQQVLRYKIAYENKYNTNVHQCIIIGTSLDGQTNCRVIDESNNIIFYNWTDFILEFCDLKAISFVSDKISA